MTVNISNNFLPINTNKPVESVHLTYSDSMIKDVIIVDSIELIFEKDTLLIKNEDFNDFGIFLDDKLNFPMIKSEEKGKFENYLESKLIGKNYKELYKPIKE